jgi:hypothetical protein
MDRTVKAEDVQISTLAAFTDGGYAKVIDLHTFIEYTDKYLLKKLE